MQHIVKITRPNLYRPKAENLFIIIQKATLFKANSYNTTADKMDIIIVIVHNC